MSWEDPIIVVSYTDPASNVYSVCTTFLRVFNYQTKSFLNTIVALGVLESGPTWASHTLIGNRCVRMPSAKENTLQEQPNINLRTKLKLYVMDIGERKGTD